MKCPRCGYEWESKIPQPKECPRCKGRLDYQPGPVGAPKILKKGGEKEMTSKLPLATAAVIIVVAAIGAWTIWGQAPAAPPAGAASVGVGAANVAFAENALMENSRIENVYIMANGTYTNTDNLVGHANILEYEGTDAVITQSGDSVNIPYDTYFDIVVAVRINSADIAILGEENVRVELAVSGPFSIAIENSANDNEFTYDTEGSENLYLNVIWDNDGTGYTLGPGGVITIDPINLYTWK